MPYRWMTILLLVWTGGALAKEDPRRPHVGSTQPPIPAETAQGKFKVPEGYEVRLFAAEPDVVNPVAMAFDEKGRLWVVELYEYPNGAKPGEKGRDRVKVYWDTDGDERADKSVVFCDGLSLATAIQVGDGGVYVGQAPHLYFYPIVSDGPEGPKAGERKTILTGFGLHDRHELLNSFCWGPEGYLYMTHGVFTHSKVKDPENPGDDGITMNAAVAQVRTRGQKGAKFELFSDGISNQWGVDWDRAGNAFVSACVVEHIWHVSPGGVYVRQGGQPTIPFTYQLLASINKDRHRHFMAAYGGICIYQGDNFPKEKLGTVFMGNIHGNCIDHDRLEPDGASFTAHDQRKASDAGEWLEANDDWFRPVNEQVGPDGALWLMDWYDKYPCYQNKDAPDLDRERGRIWRVVYVGNEKGKKVPAHRDGKDWAKASDVELVRLLEHANVWHRRVGQRLLSERKARVGSPLVALLKSGKPMEARLFALWTLFSTGNLDEQTLDAAAADAEPAVRAWAGRLTGERGEIGATATARLLKLAADKDPGVRAFVAYAARRLASADTMPVVATLLQQPGTESDPVLPFMIWMAAEPKAAGDHREALKASQTGQANPAQLDFIRKVARRVADTKDPVKLADMVAYLGSLPEAQAPVAVAVIDGLLDARQEVVPATRPDDVLGRLRGSSDHDLAERANRLAALWGNAAAAEVIVKVINDAGASEDEKLRAVWTARDLKTDGCRRALVSALAGGTSERFKVEVVRALADFAGDEATASSVLAQWKGFSPDGRRAVSDVMATRTPWARTLLNGVQNKQVALTEIPITAVRTMWKHNESRLNRLLTAHIGPFRESPAEKLALIAQKKDVVLNGPVDLEAGKAVFAKSCGVCHQFFGEGTATVGPDLTGVGRSSIDSLLANLIDPSQIIGKGYENTIVETNDGQLLTGRLTEETDDHVKLLAQGPQEHLVQRRNVRKMRQENLSVMPESLEQMPDADFRNLVWYVVSPPQDARLKRVRLEKSGNALLVKAKLPGAETMTELLACVTDPGLRPYLHPVRDASGKTVLTEDRPADHPWQHGIFTGLHKVNGLDFWSEKKGETFGSQHFVKLLDVLETVDRVSWRALGEWRDPAGRVVLEEEQEIVVHAVDSPDFYRIDFEWTLRAPEKEVKVGRWDYGGFSVRMRSTPEHAHVNGNFEQGMATANKTAKWANVANPYGHREWHGIAVLDHPSNFGFPSTWRVDGQGLINPSPSLKGDWTIEGGKSRTFRYRLIVHKGQGEPAMLEREWSSFAAEGVVPGATTK